MRPSANGTGHEVVIAGAGPTGMMLAAELTLAGAEVIIVARDPKKMAETLAEREGVLVRPGSEFGLPGYIRVTTGEEELMETVGAQIAGAGRR